MIINKMIGTKNGLFQTINYNIRCV